MGSLKIHNWDKWQSYRKDRGQPPWIKIHRRIMRNVEWVSMTDIERGQLVAMWLLAADHDGVIPASPEMIQKLCFMSSKLNLQRFIDLGFICHDGVNLASEWRQDVTPKAEADKRRIETDNGVIDAKISFGSFNNVKLTKEEHQKLILKFGESDANRRIETLSEYISSKGRKYHSHYATILTWARKDGWKDGNKNHGGVNDNVFLRTLHEEDERAARRRLGGRAKEIPGFGHSQGGTTGDGGVPEDADAAGRNSADDGESKH